MQMVLDLSLELE